MSDKFEQAQEETAQAVAALQALADSQLSAEKQTVAQIEKLFGAPADTREQFASIKNVVLNLAGRVALLEAAREPQPAVLLGIDGGAGTPPPITPDEPQAPVV